MSIGLVGTGVVGTAGHRVVALAYDGLCTFEFGLVVEVFGLDRPELPPLDRPWYELTVAAVDPPPLRAAGGVRVAVDAGLEALDDAGTIVVPGWRDLDDDPPAELVERLVAAVERGGRLVSICSGVFLLAATGLLDGRRATTHWRHADRLRARRPAVEVDPDVLYVDEGSIITSAGSAAGLDACLHLVRRDHGPEVAGLVARRLVVPPHRDGGQAQFVPRPSGPPAHGPEAAAVARAMDWATERLDQPLTVEDLARSVDVSPRTFSRRFAEQVGTSPYRWLTAQRLARARDLLEATDAPIDDVATACGFATAATLRHHFTRAFGTSPSGYRRRFGTRGTGGEGDGPVVRGNGRTNPVGSTLGR